MIRLTRPANIGGTVVPAGSIVGLDPAAEERFIAAGSAERCGIAETLEQTAEELKGAEGQEAVPIDEMSIEDLRKLAEEAEIDIDGLDTREEIAEAVQAAIDALEAAKPKAKAEETQQAQGEAAPAAPQRGFGRGRTAKVGK
jgi:hypothetical protein